MKDDERKDQEQRILTISQKRYGRNPLRNEEPVNLDNVSIILIPYNYPERHWTLYVAIKTATASIIFRVDSYENYSAAFSSLPKDDWELILHATSIVFSKVSQLSLFVHCIYRFTGLRSSVLWGC